MKLRTFRILVITGNTALNNQIHKYLNCKHYVLESTGTPESGLKKFRERPFNLVIYQEPLKEKVGFRFYKKIEHELDKRNTAFFLLVNQYQMEDLKLGLELGIDNFIFTPIDETSIRNKVDKLCKRASFYNYYETPRFYEQFQSSPIPMFFSEDLKITEGNAAFSKLFGRPDKQPGCMHFNDVFNLNGNQYNRLNVLKLENGLIDQCWLDDVASMLRPQQKFSLYKSVIGGRDSNRILTFLMPRFNLYDTKSESTDSGYSGNGMQHNEWPANPGESSFCLTSRESEIFSLSASGVPLKQIAAHLNLSQRTVEKHRANIMKKTNSHSMVEAIHKLRRSGEWY